MDKLIIAGATYKVAEDLGFIHSLGCYARAVETPHGPRIAACPAGGEWAILWCFAPADDGPRLRMGYRGARRMFLAPEFGAPEGPTSVTLWDECNNARTDR